MGGCTAAESGATRLQHTGAMRLIPLSSEALAAVGYDPASRTLRVRFEHGGLYDYFDVPAYVFEGLFNDEHPWTTWAEHIRTSYDYERLE